MVYFYFPIATFSSLSFQFSMLNNFIYESKYFQRIHSNFYFLGKQIAFVKICVIYR